MFNHIIDLKEAWEEKEINIYPGTQEKRPASDIKGLSHASYWQKQPFDN